MCSCPEFVVLVCMRDDVCVVCVRGFMSHTTCLTTVYMFDVLRADRCMNENENEDEDEDGVLFVYPVLRHCFQKQGCVRSDEMCHITYHSLLINH